MSKAKILGVSLFIASVLIAAAYFYSVNTKPGVPEDASVAGSTTKNLFAPMKSSAALAKPATSTQPLALSVGNRAKDAVEPTHQNLAGSSSAAVVMPHEQLTALAAEEQLLKENSISLAPVAALMKSDKFDAFIDRISQEAVQEPLAQDVTELYKSSAEDARSNAEDVVVRNIACGMKMCAVSLTASASETFEPWLSRFMSNTSAPTYSLGRHDKGMPNGLIERRIIFSTDPGTRGVYAPLPPNQ